MNVSVQKYVKLIALFLGGLQFEQADTLQHG